ncbi:hypothetical protein [Nitrosophilus alvini]|uniref:hypothetical protein n=1 Tax=Nitrosophilus alvini TaxID=2714855 RepID=UPI00190BBD3C|nr:hypothetical protein [Nitrosophilus alvini]
MMEKIRDIKPLVEIPDISFYAYIISFLLFSVFVAVLLFKVLKILKRKKRNERKILLQKLKSIDVSDSKKAAYEITKYGRKLVNDERSRRIFLELLPKLEKYKYRKKVPNMDEETIRYFTLFIETVNE